MWIFQNLKDLSRIVFISHKFLLRDHMISKVGENAAY